MVGERKMVDSGVEWIGEIPEGWGTVKMKEVSILNPHVKLPSDGTVSFIPMEQLQFGNHKVDQTISLPSNGSYTKFCEGDILVAKVTPCFENGKIAVSSKLVNGVGLGSSEITPIRATGINSRYLMYIMRSQPFIDAGCITMSGSAGLQRVASYFWRETGIPLPAPDIQQAIATFLDHHTSLIDSERNLIAQKIELLKEKRKALIFECVTGKRTIVEAQHLAGVDDWSNIVGTGQYVAVPAPKKDDPFAKQGRLVDSGVEWIGEIPEGWKIVRSRSIGTIQKKINHGMKETNRLALTMKGVIRRSLEDDEGLQTSNFEGYQIFEKEDLVFKLIDLQNLKTSRVGMVHERGIMSPAYIRFTPNGRAVMPDYLFYHFYAAYNRDIFNDMGGGVRQTMGRSDLLNFLLVLPPIDEQKIIATFLSQQISGIDEEISLLILCNELLVKKRKSLIFEAVTGKIQIGDL